MVLLEATFVVVIVDFVVVVVVVVVNVIVVVVVVALLVVTYHILFRCGLNISSKDILKGIFMHIYFENGQIKCLYFPFLDGSYSILQFGHF